MRLYYNLHPIRNLTTLGDWIWEDRDRDASLETSEPNFAHRLSGSTRNKHFKCSNGAFDSCSNTYCTRQSRLFHSTYNEHQVVHSDGRYSACFTKRSSRPRWCPSRLMAPFWGVRESADQGLPATAGDVQPIQVSVPSSTAHILRHSSRESTWR